jgi:hypothetical protein
LATHPSLRYFLIFSQKAVARYRMIGLPNVAKEVYIKYKRTRDSLRPILSPRYLQTPKLLDSNHLSTIFRIMMFVLLCFLIKNYVLYKFFIKPILKDKVKENLFSIVHQKNKFSEKETVWFIHLCFFDSGYISKK